MQQFNPYHRSPPTHAPSNLNSCLSLDEHAGVASVADAPPKEVHPLLSGEFIGMRFPMRCAAVPCGFDAGPRRARLKQRARSA